MRKSGNTIFKLIQKYSLPKIKFYGIREKVFVLSFLQGRDPNWCKQPFFAQYNPNATWLSELKPALGEKKFFFEDRLGLYLERRFSNKDSGENC